MVSIWLSLGRHRPTTQPPCYGIDKKLPACVSADASPWDPLNLSPSTTKHTRGEPQLFPVPPSVDCVDQRDMSHFPLPKLEIHGGHNHHGQMKSLSFELVCYTAINNWNTANESPVQNCPPLPSYLITPWLQLQPVNYSHPQHSANCLANRKLSMDICRLHKWMNPLVILESLIGWEFA